MFYISPASVVQPQPILQLHSHKPRLPVAPVEYGGRSIVESLCIPDGLRHGLAYIQLLHPLDLDVDAGQSCQIRNRPIAERTAPLDLVTVFMKEGGQLPLAVRSFPL